MLGTAKFAKSRPIEINREYLPPFRPRLSLELVGPPVELRTGIRDPQHVFAVLLDELEIMKLGHILHSDPTNDPPPRRLSDDQRTSLASVAAASEGLAGPALLVIGNVAALDVTAALELLRVA